MREIETHFERRSCGQREQSERKLRELAEENYLLLPSSRITKTIIQEH